MRKTPYGILLVLALLLMSGCSLISSSGEKASSISSFPAQVSQTIEVYIDVLPKDYFFVQEGGVSLYDESGEVIRPLFFQEKVFLIRKGVQRSLVEDFTGLRGYVDRTSLGKNFTSYIDNYYEGVEYGMYAEKNKPHRDYVPVRGVYVPPSKIHKIDELMDRIEGSVINTLIIDYKDDYDRILFSSPAASEYVPDSNAVKVENAEAYMEKIKSRGYRTIARIVVLKSDRYAMQYPDLSINTPSGNLYVSDNSYWASPYDRQMWQYIIRLSNEAIAYGFDEIQYDYIRFPVTYGEKTEQHNLKEESRPEAIQKFLMYAQSNIDNKDAIIAADIFGWSAVSITDEGIGQQWEAMSVVSDVICPMFYPSLFISGNLGLDSPQRQPYETIKRAMDFAIERNENIPTPAIIRPWLQDYDSYVSYGDQEVADQVQALYDLGVYEYMLWNPDGYYHLGGLNDLSPNR